ncbi:MAG: methyltransferase domain-containing protein [Bacteroidota bacterium]
MQGRKLLKHFFPEPNPFNDDRRFIEIYPQNIQKISQRHWTPVSVIRQAARFLSPAPNLRILDIGSGIGKFCLVAAHDNPDSIFIGVEQRAELVQVAEHAKEILAIKNVIFHHENITGTDLSAYDHFFFFNSFFEQIEPVDRMDGSIVYSNANYAYYTEVLYKKLEILPPGTRLVTYHGKHSQVPPGFVLRDRTFDNLLEFWIKN